MVGEVVGLVVLLCFVLPFLPNGEGLLTGFAALLSGLALLMILGAALWVVWRLWNRLTAGCMYVERRGRLRA